MSANPASSSTSIPSVTLNNQVAMPLIGYGVFRIAPNETADRVASALGAGYRLVDTASAYGNEEGVGQGLRQSGLAREEVFVTTKVWVTQYGEQATRRAVATSLRRLGLPFVDMLLLHFPVPSAFERTIAAWRVLEEALDKGLVRAIGVCNFHPHHLERLMAATDVVPAVNQVELHPCCNQETLMRFHREHGIVTQAWSPLGGVMAYDAAGLDSPRQLLDEPLLQDLAAKYGKSPAQIVLRWHLQRGVATIPKTVSTQRMVQNLDIFDFVLAEEDMAALMTLDRGFRGALDPDDVTLETYPADVAEHDDPLDQCTVWS